MPLALKGINVLDLTIFGAGPVCTMILGDMGAEVVKLERRGTGDMARWDSPIVGDMGAISQLSIATREALHWMPSTPRPRSYSEAWCNGLILQ